MQKLHTERTLEQMVIEVEAVSIEMFQLKSPWAAEGRYPLKSSGKQVEKEFSWDSV